VWLGAAAIAAGAALVNYERNPVRTHPHPVAAADATGPQSIIVKLRPATGATNAAANAATPAVDERLRSLAGRTRLTLSSFRSITSRMHVMQVEDPSGESVAATLARLRADSDVEYAELNQRRYIHATPNDPIYSSLPPSPVYGEQWYLMPSSSTTPAAIDAQTAWTTTTGSSSLVIADIDTGVRAEHPDLTVPGGTSRLLAGYCFISNSFIANNNSCPGPGALDPGDWVTSDDISGPSSNSICSGASVEPSSWHGTRTAGILGAIANNSQGIAGMTWSGNILPLRALGVCGGEDADIITAMLYAAGVAVTVNGSEITNPTPAKIINMSLGGSGSCPSTYSDAISQVTALGALVVVSAGNETGPVDAPANCPGVAGVVGLREDGTKVGYSSYGPEAALGAPAGNCINTTLGAGSPCVYPITSTTNLGSAGPDADDYTGLYYCAASGSDATGSYANCTVSGTQYRTYNLGTSFSAPLVAGIGALMASVNPKLNSCQLISRLQEGSLPYPQSSIDTSPQPPICSDTVSASSITGGQCICTTGECGAGMANAAGAITAAQRPIAALTASVPAGQRVQLNAAGSAAIPGHLISSYAWSSIGPQSAALSSASGSTTTATAPSCGLATVQLVVTDDDGRIDTTNVVLSPTSATTTAPAAAGDACSATTVAIELAVCPTSASVQATGGTQTFTATVANTSNAAVTWQVNGETGGNSTNGTISAGGLYTAPATVPNTPNVTVTAISAADSSVTATSQVTITPPPPPTVTLTANPASIASGMTSTLNWSSSSATSCTASGGWSGNESTSGSTTTAALTTTTTYTLTCTGAGGSTSASTTVSVPSKKGGGALDWMTLGVSLALLLGRRAPARVRARARRQR
jgi:serine protease